MLKPHFPSLNFYRLHLAYFVLTSLLASVIFYASNGANHVSYTDSLFLCISAMTISGLNTVNLSLLTTWQQVILFFLMAIGGGVFVSAVTVFVRLHFFSTKFKDVAKQLRQERSEINRALPENGVKTHQVAWMSPSRRPPIDKSMIRVVAAELQHSRVGSEESRTTEVFEQATAHGIETLQLSTVRILQPPESTQTIVVDEVQEHRPLSEKGHLPRAQTTDTSHPDAQLLRNRCLPADYTRSQTLPTSVSAENGSLTQTQRTEARHPDYYRGGLPTPGDLARVLRRHAPRLQNTLSLQPTISRQPGTFQRNISEDIDTSPSYFSFYPLTSRNSQFLRLTDEQLEELGGVEYMALRALSWLIPLYYLGVQLLAFLVTAPWIGKTGSYSTAMAGNKLPVSPVFFSAFQVISAFGNCGMSLADLNMTAFGSCYGLIFPLILVILAGNTAYPVFLRLIIWLLSRLFSQQSKMYATFRFLLDHPRRCFLYLFPSNQTWWLVATLVMLNVTDWVCFLVLDLSNEQILRIPVGQRIVDGLFQAFSVRTGGFYIVNLSQIAPALQLLYMVMMYVSAYPVALSIRHTNVYEERSVGIFQDDDNKESVIPQSDADISNTFLAFHVRKQLSYDLWWLFFAAWIICIVERAQLQDSSKSTWFTIFSVMFEVVSGYGTVGISLGVPFDNYSFCGTWHTLSKLVMCAVMLRGRHRGLPLAIDRSIMLPSELKNLRRKDEERKPERRRHFTL